MIRVWRARRGWTACAHVSGHHCSRTHKHLVRAVLTAVISLVTWRFNGW